MQVWQNLSIDSNERLQALNTLIQEHYAANLPDSTRHYALELYEEAKAEENRYFQGTSQYFLGNALLRLGLYETALSHHQEAARIWEELDNQNKLAHSYNSLGIISKRLGRLSEAETYLKNSVAAHFQVGDSLQTAGPYLNLAAIAEARGDVFQSMAYNQQALSITRQSEDVDFQGIAHIGLANNYKYQGDIAKATTQYLQARTIYEQTAKPAGMIDVLNNLSVLLIDNQEFEHVEGYLNEALISQPK